MIDIISMNPSGLWRGQCQGRVGNFKFINVDIVNERRRSTGGSGTEKRRAHRARETRPSAKPKTVEEMLKRIGLEVESESNWKLYLTISNTLHPSTGPHLGVRSERV